MTGDWFSGIKFLLQAIVNFFDRIMTTIENFFNSMNMAVTWLTDSFRFVMQTVPFLPTVIGAAVTTVAMFAILKFILGRMGD